MNTCSSSSLRGDIIRAVVSLGFLLSLGGCDNASIAADVCQSVPPDGVAAAVGSKLVKAELDTGKKDSRAVRSTCVYDFENGDRVRVAINEYSDIEYAKERQFQLQYRSPNIILSEQLGYDVYHSAGTASLEAVVSPQRHFYVEINRKQDKIEAEGTHVEGGMVVTTFKKPHVENADEKVEAIAKLIRFPAA